MSSFSQALASGRPVVTAECTPPHSGDPADIKKLAAVLPAALDAVVVADNPDDIHGSALAWPSAPRCSAPSASCV